MTDAQSKADGSSNAGSIVGLALVASVFLGGFGWYKYYGPVEGSDLKTYGPQCTAWISKEFNSGRKSYVYDSWKKRGYIVFQVATAIEGDNRVSLQLCVIDKSKGTMEKPSILDRSWN